VEVNVNTKERLLLVLNLVYQGKISAHVVTDLQRTRTWAGVWLKRYEKEGLEGLKNKPRSGRPSELPEEDIFSIKTILKESDNQGWTTKQVEELIIKKSGIKYHYTRIYRCILRKWGFKQKVPRKIHVNTASKEGKEAFKKRLQNKYLWISKSSSKSRSTKQSLP
jgi:putative transposase